MKKNETRSKYRVVVLRISNLTTYFEIQKRVWWCFWVSISDPITQHQVEKALDELQWLETKENVR